MIARAVDAAAKSDIVIYVGGWTHGYDYSVWKDNAYDAEDTDKPDMHMPFGQDSLLSAILKVNTKVIVVLMGGGAIDMSQWIDKVPAVIQYWYPGMDGGNALSKILTGEVNPSGKLPMTFPKKLEDHGSHALGEYPGDTKRLIVNYTDDIYVGYRYYDRFKVDPLFAFGHGLSYTSFNYSDLKIVNGETNASVTFTVKNTGKLSGAEVTQVYVHQDKPSLPRPDKELKGFQKVFLQPGESKTVTIKLSEDAFSYYNDLLHKWTADPGSFTVLIGSSSRDIRLKGNINFKNGSSY
jgi:beta-glucosidase